jgi:hypothetical protein
MPTALLGFHPSKRSPLAGWCRVSTITAPTYCLSRVFSACDKHKLAGHTGRSFWVPVRRESLVQLPVLGASNTGCSLGLFCLPGLTRRATLAKISLSLPSRAFEKRPNRSPRHLRVSISALRAQQSTALRATQSTVKQPSETFVHHDVHSHSPTGSSELCVHLLDRRTSPLDCEKN